MGASNSKPQTVQIPNTSPFQVSREALERVEKAAKPEKSASSNVCENCSRTNSTTETGGVSTQQPVSIASSWTRRFTEIEEMQFSKTLDRVHHLFGRPFKWAKAKKCSADIDLMEKELIACYREYGSEPLKCASLAAQYHTFVFNKQVAAVKNTNSDGQSPKMNGSVGK